MKQHEARAFIPLLQAWADGGELEYSIHPSGGKWAPMNNQHSVSFFDPISHYRIKPRLVTRRLPLGPQDFPPGTVLERAHEVGWLTIAEVFEEGIWAAGSLFSYADLAKSNRRRLLPGADPATGWLPCYREVTEEQPAPPKPAEHLPLPAGHTYHNPDNVPESAVPEGYRFAVKGEVTGEFCLGAQIWDPSVNEWWQWPHEEQRGGRITKGQTIIVPTSKLLPPDEAP